MKIAILYICTGKYTVFWKDFYTSCEKNFIPEAEKHYFVFTDSDQIAFEKENPNIHKIFQKNLGWPNNTLKRYEVFLQLKETLLNFDFVFFFNADLVFLKTIQSSDFLPSNNENLVACLHPGYFNKKKSTLPYETDVRSRAFMKAGRESNYFAGGINGGKAKDFIEAIEKINKNIEQDSANNIVAKWHDESHWNKYLETYKNVKILHPGYLYPEAGAIPYEKIIMIRDKRKYFSYAQIGKNETASTQGSLQKIKTKLEEFKFIQHSLSWQLFKKWINRLHLLRTIYRNSKLKAIKSYFKNDIEYAKIKKEIDRYKVGNTYNFAGVKLPLSIITADTFLNVIKPNIKNIEYTENEIEKFYNEQKDTYSTLSYWKDMYLEREPDYIGAHIISHGFTYFFKEICIEKNDTVIDLGAAPGDFSAICIQKGASRVYAFEPEESNSSNLQEASILNENKIKIIRKYCGAQTNDSQNTISLDDFVKINNIDKVDFIKSDIEGAEVSALLGAKNILKNHRPKLSFCTYHSITDEDEIEKAILAANPEYKIYKRKGVIYAF
jgi:hypothetical protein